jgi:microcystin-dependent protein
MAEPYIGEIRMFAGNFAPVGWLFCDGQLLPIAENEALFQLIGTTYGGDGEETFALPNLQSRIPSTWERDERASLISWQRRAAQGRRR